MLVVGSLLGACTSDLRSNRPWFTVEDARSAPAVRSGWWAPVDKYCRIAAKAPSAAWPDCVAPILVPPGDRLIVEIEMMGKTGGSSYLLVAGKPPILQVFNKDDSLGEPLKALEYAYYGVKPRRHDRQGRITALALWPTLCGPPGPATKAHPYLTPTQHPWPGLDLGFEAKLCTARDVQALREAVRRSAPFSQDRGAIAFRWIRDWQPGDQTREEWLAALAAQSH